MLFALAAALAPNALLMPSPARHTGPALRSRVAAAPTMTAFGQQSCQQPEIGGLRAGEIGAPYPGPPSLVGDRDACGVGFLADQKGRRRHDIMARALVALGCMEHRGGCGGDSVSGDGAGVLTSVPWELFEADGHLKGHSSDSCGVAMTFLPTNAREADQVKTFFDAQAKRRGLEVLGWRNVPQRKEVLGPMALVALPDIQQCFLHHPTARGDELEVLLYETRRSIQADIFQVTTRDPDPRTLAPSHPRALAPSRPRALAPSRALSRPLSPSLALSRPLSPSRPLTLSP